MARLQKTINFSEKNESEKYIFDYINNQEGDFSTVGKQMWHDYIKMKASNDQLNEIMCKLNLIHEDIKGQVDHNLIKNIQAKLINETTENTENAENTGTTNLKRDFSELDDF